jgi:uncharacterized membrane protein
VKFGDIDAPVVYPPLALDELAIVGRVHLALHDGQFEDNVALTTTIKGAIVLLDAALPTLMFTTVRRAAGSSRAWWAAMAYWVNPAVLMATTLGYIDVFLAIPAVGAVVAGSYGRPWLAGALFTAAVTTKPQGLFVGICLSVCAAMVRRSPECAPADRSRSGCGADDLRGVRVAGCDPCARVRDSGPRTSGVARCSAQ